MTIDNNSTANPRYLKITATAGKTSFVYNFKIFSADDLIVYQDNTLLTLNTDYTVTGVGDQDGGTVDLTVAASDGDIITIESNVLDDQEVNYSVGGKLTANSLETALDKMYVLLQQLNTTLNYRGLLYEVEADIDATSTRKDTTLPVLASQSGDDISVWSKNSDGQLIATTITEEGGCSTLRSDLANNNNGTDGAKLVGYYNATSGSDNTVKKALDDIYTDVTTNTAAIATLEGEINSGAQFNELYGGYFLQNPWQRGQTFNAASSPNNNDGTTFADQWVLLSDGNDIVDITKNDIYARFDVQTPNKQFGAVQVLPLPFWGKVFAVGRTISIGVFLKASTTITCRMALIYWDGTEDAFDKDPIQTWNGLGTNPTLTTNWNYASTPVDLDVTTSDTLFKENNIDVDSIMTTVGSKGNFGFMFWVDDTTIAGGVTLDCKGAILVNSSEIKEDYIANEEYSEILRCQRFYRKSYNNDVYAGATTDVGAKTGLIDVYEDRLVDFNETFDLMYKVPTMSWYSPNTGTVNRYYDIGNATDRTIISTNDEGQKSTGYPTASTIGQPTRIDGIVHWVAEVTWGT